MKKIILMLIILILVCSCAPSQPKEEIEVVEIEEKEEVIVENVEVVEDIKKDIEIEEEIEKPEESKKEPEIEDSKEEIKNEIKQEIKDEINEETEEMSQELTELLTISDIKVKSYSYIYTEPPLNNGGDRWNVKGNKIRIDLLQSDVNLVKGYNVIFIDTLKRKAEGYCIGDKIRCKEGQLMFDLDYDEIIRDTPYQWLKKIKEGKIKESITIEGRENIIVEYGNNSKQYIEKYYGLPMRVQVGEDTWQFMDMNINGVTDEYITP